MRRTAADQSEPSRIRRADLREGRRCSGRRVSLPSLTHHQLFPMASIRIPTPLRKLTNELEVVQASGANVGEILANLEKAFPGLKERICDEQGNVRRFVNV